MRAIYFNPVRAWQVVADLPEPFPTSTYVFWGAATFILALIISALVTETEEDLIQGVTGSGLAGLLWPVAWAACGALACLGVVAGAVVGLTKSLMWLKTPRAKKGTQ